jgi:hypothetical protein
LVHRLRSNDVATSPTSECELRLRIHADLTDAKVGRNRVIKLMQERALIMGPFQRVGIGIHTPSGGEQDLSSSMGQLYVTMQTLAALGPVGVKR